MDRSDILDRFDEAKATPPEAAGVAPTLATHKIHARDISVSPTRLSKPDIGDTAYADAYVCATA